MLEVSAATGEPIVDKSRRQVVLLPSVFEGRPPVVFFSYTDACGAEQRPMDRAVPTRPDVQRLFYTHTDKVHEYNAVINILKLGGLHRVREASNKWCLLWSNHPPPETLRALKPLQRTNHFPGSRNLGRKDLIWQNVSNMQKKFGRAFNITPMGFVLPKSMDAFKVAQEQQPDALWIWKPCGQSCGRGIRVLSSSTAQEEVQELSRKRGVVQKYIHNPLLIDGYKFDLRVYVVVLSYDPLKVYINDEGLVRLATEKYSSSPDTLESRTMHLTNYSVNKTSPAFVQNSDGRGAKSSGAAAEDEGAAEEEEEPRAFKWSFSELRAYMNQHGHDYNLMFDRIKDLVIKTLLAVERPIRNEWTSALGQPEESWAARVDSGCNRTSCFEMYGFDVLTDVNMKPWLLEVNICPSLSSGSPLDKRIKTKLMADTLTLVGLRPPPSMWKGCMRSRARSISTQGDAEVALNLEQGPGLASHEDERERAAELLECGSARDALAQFDEAEWEMAVDAHDEDMRSGGLERIYPTANSHRYVQYMGEESYCNVVLRKWQEAGGGKLFSPSSASRLPPFVPRQVCFSRT